MTSTEQLLRRMTGSITAYMDEVGARPQHMSTADRAVLAVRDGELYAFSSLALQVTEPEGPAAGTIQGHTDSEGGSDRWKPLN